MPMKNAVGMLKHLVRESLASAEDNDYISKIPELVDKLVGVLAELDAAVDAYVASGAMLTTDPEIRDYRASAADIRNDVARLSDIVEDDWRAAMGGAIR